MSNDAVKVLDTANPTASPSDTGPTQTMTRGFLKKNVPIRFSVDLSAGDTVVIEGKSDSSEDFEVLHTFTTETPADVYVSKYWRARRSVDGAAGEAQCFAENHRKLPITEDAAS